MVGMFSPVTLLSGLNLVGEAVADSGDGEDETRPLGIWFDFFLVPPFYSFTISRGEEWIALFVFLATALITSQLATVTRQSVEQARLREQEARPPFFGPFLIKPS